MQSRQAEYRQKHKSIVQYMESHHIDAVVLTRRCNFAWYTCGGLNHVSTAADLGASTLVITPEQAVCVTNTIEAPRVSDEELADMNIEVRASDWHNDEDAANILLAAIGGRQRIASDARIPGLPEDAMILRPDFDTLRWSLTEGEIERYRTLGKEVGDALESACRLAKAGMSEHELASIVSAKLLQRSIRVPVVLIAADKRVRQYRHPIPTSKKFEHYGMAVCCGERSGLILSNTRLFSFGPISDDLRRRHEAVCAVDAAMIAATRPGQSLGDVFSVARRAYADAGFPDEWKCHHQGGSTGYTGRAVKGTPGNPVVVQVNQAFAGTLR